MPKGIYDRKKAARKKARRIAAPKKAVKKRAGRPAKKLLAAGGADGFTERSFITGCAIIGKAIEVLAEAIEKDRKGATGDNSLAMPVPNGAQLPPDLTDDRAGATAAEMPSS